MVKVSTHHKLLHSHGIQYRIDKDETLNNLSTPMCNLANLFRSDSTLDNKLRQSIIHRKIPEFSTDIENIDSGKR